MDEIQNNIKCPKCKKIIDKNLIIIQKCGHICCKECIQSYDSSSE